MTTYVIHNNNYFTQVAAKSIPGLPDGEVLPLAVVLAWTPPRWQKWHRKRLQMTTYLTPNNTYLAQVAAKSIPGLPDGEVLPLGVASPFPAVRG